MTEETTNHHPDQTTEIEPHDMLVDHFRRLIAEHQNVHKLMYPIEKNGNDAELLSPERAVRNVLEWYSWSPSELGDHMFTVRSAWDAMVYDRYEPGSREEGVAGSVLQAYYTATREPKIKLTDPRQVKVLDALAEAANVPRQRGQSEIEIPEKLRNYNNYVKSPEYQARLTEAKAKRLK